MMRLIGNPLIVGLLFMSCTESPFGENEIATPGRQLSGTVTISTGHSPTNAYVWFEGFDQSVRPDDSGDFTLSVPPPAIQNAEGGLTGAFRVFAYIANYSVVTRTVILNKGLLLTSEADLREDGQLFPGLFLAEKLKVTTNVRPTEVQPERGRLRFQAEVVLQAVKDTTDVLFSTIVGDKIGPLFILNTDTGQVFSIETLIVSDDASDFIPVGTRPFLRTFLADLDESALPPGNYQVIPYVLIVNQPVPRELINSLGIDVENFGPRYLNLPFIRHGGEFEVSSSQ